MSDQQTFLSLGPPPIVAGDTTVRTKRITDGVQLEIEIDHGEGAVYRICAELPIEQTWNLGEQLRHLAVAPEPTEP
jgi:hypothetical protein